MTLESQICSALYWIERSMERESHEDKVIDLKCYIITESFPKLNNDEQNKLADATITTFTNYDGPTYEKSLAAFKELYPTINIKREGELVIFNYRIEANFFDPVIQEARGIIINLKKLDVVCWPFRKFSEYDEPHADKIDWATAVAQDKLDGSIIKLWYNSARMRWQFSTNSTIDAKDAFLTNLQSFMDIIKETEEYKILQLKIEWGHLDMRCTYIFELTTPVNTIVINYPTPKLTHIGTRINSDGRELSDCDIEIPKPKSYRVRTIDEVIALANSLNRSKSGKIKNITHEGFVVVDGNFNRIKVKSPVYIAIQGVYGNISDDITGERILDFLRNGMLSVNSICKHLPRFAPIIKYYDYQYAQFVSDAHKIIYIARRLYSIFDGNRKEVALRIAKHPLKSFGFMALDNPDLDADEIIAQWNEKGKNITNFIPAYHEDDSLKTIIKESYRAIEIEK